MKQAMGRAKKQVFNRPAFSPARYLRFVLALAVLLAGAGLTAANETKARNAYADAQFAAAEQMTRAMDFLRAYVRREGIAMEADDLNQTGLVGPEWTELTTSLGHLEAKRTALQPDFAALMVKYYRQLGLRPGDTVACGMSGSFPGLCIAAVAAANQMGLRMEVIASYGASMYGATRPELSVVRMLNLCKEAGLLQFELLAASPGGDFDQGASVLYPNSREVIFALAQADGVPMIDEPDIPRSVQRRLALYGDDVACFVNVGGASANVGTSSYTLSFPNGLTTDPPRIPLDADRGMVFEYAARGKPIIHLLNIRGLAQEHGIAIDPVPITLSGETAIYYTTRRSPWYALAALALAAALLLRRRRGDGIL